MAPGGDALAKAVHFVSCWLAFVVLLIAGPAAAGADDFRTPATAALRVEWRTALDQLRSEISTRPAIAGDFTFSGQRRLAPFDPRTMPALVQLNGVTSQIFTGIGRSRVPVLLPFDTAAFLEARLNRAPSSLSLARYQADFSPADMFDAGPAGYDAAFSLDPGAGDGMPQRIFAKPVEVQITGSNLIYDLSDPQGGKGEPVRSLMAQFPDLRRFIREGYVRYAFTRFGVAYVVSIQCLELDAADEAAGLPRGLSRRRTFPEGAAHRGRAAVATAQATFPPSSQHGRPSAPPISPIIPPATSSPIHGSRRQSGRADLTVYSQIRFPLEKAPALVRSQSFGRRSRSDSRSASYPWRDNFCEARAFNVGQCTSGFGHQGQDVRPGECPVPNDGGERCDPRQQGVVAVRDGVVIRAPKQQAATLQVNSRTEHIRFRYMHMNPASLDADGILNGRARCRRRTDRRGLELSRPSQRHQPPPAFRRPGVYPRRLAVGQSLRHADFGL